jgi:hypothetical protein
VVVEAPARAAGGAIAGGERVRGLEQGGGLITSTTPEQGGGAIDVSAGDWTISGV